MATVELNAMTREAGTKGDARRLRADGNIPAIVYGTGNENRQVALEAHGFENLLRHISSGNQILDLHVDGQKSADKVLIKEVQRHPVSQKILHVDLQRIDMTKKVKVHIPVHLHGNPIGVKEGGILEHLLREVLVECLPSEIPAEISLDVSELVRGHSIHVRDLQMPQVHIFDSPDTVIVTVVAKAKEVVPEPAAEVAAEGQAEAAPEGAEAPKEG